MSAKQYFERYSEPEVALINTLATTIAKPYSQVLCLPIFDETSEVLTRVSQSAKSHGEKVLLIAVINQPEDSTASKVNHAFVGKVQQQAALWQQQHISLHHYASHLDILLIQRFQTGLQIPKKQGVGLARKIACDCAAYLVHAKKITSQQIFSSDGDVYFPDNYFSANLQAKHSAAHIAFKHLPSGDTDIDNATNIYEQSLHHYVQGLSDAGSAYAYHSIGSTLLINAAAYIQVRGFPKRAGAEDFYLLNKLNKIAPIHAIDKICIGIASRISQRVPFGTGPAVEKLLSQQSKLFFAPESFLLLRQLLEQLNSISNIENIGDASQLLQQKNEKITAIIEVSAIEKALKNIWANHKTATARARAIHDWFDGFRTLKTLGFISEQFYPKLSYQKWLTANTHIE